jgi:hypothetical protein
MGDPEVSEIPRVEMKITRDPIEEIHGYSVFQREVKRWESYLQRLKVCDALPGIKDRRAELDLHRHRVLRHGLTLLRDINDPGEVKLLALELLKLVKTNT